MNKNSILDNFKEVSNKYPMLYGQLGTQKRFNIKYYLKKNPESEKMIIFEIIQSLYMTKRKHERGLKREILDYEENNKLLNLKIKKLEKELKDTKEILKEKENLIQDLIN